MKKYLLVFAVCWGVAFSLTAQERKDYPCSVVDQRVVVVGFESFEGMSEETLFLSALLWAIQNGMEKKEGIQDIDMNKRNFVLERTLMASRAAIPYHSQAQFRVSDNLLSFLITDIACETKVALNMTKKLAFEKLAPETNQKHKEYLREFESLNAARLNDLCEFIRTQPLPPVTHPEQIKKGELVKGMNETECLLSFGKPLSVQESAGKVQWMYDSYTYLFFENGILTSFIR